MKADLILIHPPSVYDFREKTIMFGPMSDLVPSTPIFEMYPIGFLTISNYLKKKGFKVRIVNLAHRMYIDKNFDAEKFIKKLNTEAFGLDFHWLAHCQGSLEVAKLLKKYHPNIPIIFGGFSSSYFYRELIGYPQVDYILRGDSTEEPLARLMAYIKNGSYKLEDILNLVYKSKDNIFENPIKCISKDLEEIDFDYSIMFKQVINFLDIGSLMPFSQWYRYPITTIPIVRGCNNNCSGCGGSKTAFKLFGDRDNPAFRSPKKLVEEIILIRKYIKAPIFILGDINQGGKQYVLDFFNYAKKINKDIQIFFEFFKPPPKWFFDKAHGIFNNILYEISPDSHDEKIREKMGKPSYQNGKLKETIKYALDKGAARFDLYFMTGLPAQGKGSIMDTIGFCNDIYESINWDKRFMPFISPMAPFLDPGSRAFENPEKFGYTLTRKTLDEHVRAITEPSWKYILNYKSSAISSDDLVEYTYKAALGLNKLKGRAGAISKKLMVENEKRIKHAILTINKIDSAMGESKGKRKEMLLKLKRETDKYSMSTVCEKKELEFPFFNRSFNWLKIIKEAIF